MKLSLTHHLYNLRGTDFRFSRLIKAESIKAMKYKPTVQIVTNAPSKLNPVNLSAR